MKKTIALMIAMALCFLLAACGSSEEPVVTPDPASSASPSEIPEAEVLEITLSVSEDLTALEYDSLDTWKTLVSERSDGRIRINCVRDSGQTGSSLLEETKGGDVNVTVISTEEVCASLPEAVSLQLPFVFDSYAHAAAVFGGETGEGMYEAFGGESGIRMLNTFFGGFRYILSEMQLSAPEDCLGILIRSPRAEVFTDMMGILGFSYITMDESNAYTAMNDGVISAVEGTLSNLTEKKFYELGSYVFCTRHMLEMRHVVVNEAWWSGLTVQQREILTETLAEASAEQWDERWAEEQLAQSALEAEGVVFSELSESAKKDLCQRFAGYWETSLRSFAPEIRDIPDEIRDLA